MLVETYEIEETAVDGQQECSDEALALIESLDLDGQRELVKVDDDGDASRVPYPKMTKEQKAVIEAICPRETKLAKYADQSIPLRVLQVAAHAVQLFDELWVWHPENADEKDPYLIGKNTGGTTEGFILARWGDELLAWGELVKKAGRKLRDLRVSKLRDIAAQASAAADSAEQATDEQAAQFDMPYFSAHW
jgi:hypothetical protein